MNIVANRVNILPWTQFWCFLYSGNLYYFNVTQELAAFAARARIEEEYTDAMKSTVFLEDARGCIRLQNVKSVRAANASHDTHMMGLHTNERTYHLQASQ